jgi:predicted oxidoreductase
MKTVQLSSNLEVSQFALGFWRLKEWKMAPQALLAYMEKALDLGITTFDHADIYGNYDCETLFGEALKLKPTLRNKIQLVSKCGIKLISDKFPQRRINHYDTSYEHIVMSVEKSIQNLKTDHLDLLLIHRPDPLMDASETARAFVDLKASGKVLNFGVSNFTMADFELLQAALPFPLVTNQVEISPYQLEHFSNGNMAYFLKNKLHPMAWSPLAGGKLLNPVDKNSERVHAKLNEVASRLQIEHIDTLVYAWLLRHPVGIIPVLGTGNLTHLQQAIRALEIELTTEEWFEIYEAALGHRVP